MYALLKSNILYLDEQLCHLPLVADEKGSRKARTKEDRGKDVHYRQVERVMTDCSLDFTFYEPAIPMLNLAWTTLWEQLAPVRLTSPAVECDETYLISPDRYRRALIEN